MFFARIKSIAALLFGAMCISCAPKEAAAPFDAASLAVWLHGAAGDLCAQEIGEYGMTPTDVVAALPRVIKESVE